MAIYSDVNSQYLDDGLSESLPNAYAINNSLYNLLVCPLGSRGFQPGYGSMLASYLFDPCDPITAKKIFINFIQCVERWEPRIVLDRVNSTVVPTKLRDGYNVRLVFYIPALDRTSTFEMTATR